MHIDWHLSCFYGNWEIVVRPDCTVYELTTIRTYGTETLTYRSVS